MCCLHLQAREIIEMWGIISVSIEYTLILSNYSLFCTYDVTNLDILKHMCLLSLKYTIGSNF